MTIPIIGFPLDDLVRVETTTCRTGNHEREKIKRTSSVLDVELPILGYETPVGTDPNPGRDDEWSVGTLNSKCRRDSETKDGVFFPYH